MNKIKNDKSYVTYFLVLTVLVFASLFTSPLFAAGQGASADNSKTLFSLFVIDGGPIVWYVLIPMSVLMLFVVTVLCISFRRSQLLDNEITEEIALAVRDKKPERLVEKLSDNQDVISKVLLRVIIKSQHLKPDKKYTQELAKEALHEQGVYLLRKVEWCGIIGNVAPMVGLFGTVYGMIQAFDVLGASGGQPRPDQLAAKISIALVTTFWGLLIAIPALLIQGIFRARVEAVIGEAAVEVDSLLRQVSFNQG